MNNMSDPMRWCRASETIISNEKYYEILNNGTNVSITGGYHDITGHYDRTHRVEYGGWVYKLEIYGGPGQDNKFGMTIMDKCDNQEGDGI